MSSTINNRPRNSYNRTSDLPVRKGYAAIALRKPADDNWQILSIRDEQTSASFVVVFDTSRGAADFLPLLNEGKVCIWSQDGETCYWLNPDYSTARDGYSAGCVITDYDPYNVPAQITFNGIRSEARLMDWRYHIHFGQFFDSLKQNKRKKQREWAVSLDPSEYGIPQD